MSKKQNAEIIEKSGKLNEVIIKTTIRENGSLRIQQDFEFCPTLAEQHTAHMSDINYLIEKYKPDELAAYIAARNSHRKEIIGHDFSTEPNLQEGMNEVYRLKQAFNAIPEEIRSQFKNHVEYLKFIDNPDNQAKMLKLGILTKEQIKETTTQTTTTTTQEEKKETKE